MRRRTSLDGGASCGRLHRHAPIAAAALVAAAAGVVVFPQAGDGASVPKQAVVAQARGRVNVYRFPGAKKPFVHYGARNEWGQPRVFLVAQRLRGWERVYLPQRPDGITGWVRDSSVTLANDPWRVVVSLGGHEVSVYRLGKRVLHVKAGVGRSISATPRGNYFLVELAKQPDPNGVYGPYAFGTSAFSNTYYHFGGGPGQIGLHGTDDPAGLGTNVSHGCIRIPNWAIAHLAHELPLGTPVVIR
jgi:lipoprotein-anchoring transpeptidase ErfK/SrfK